MNHSESIAKISTALVAAQAEIGRAVKTAENPFFHSSYADLGSVMDACKDALSKNRIAIIQSPVPSEAGTVALDTVLLHESGEWISGTMVMPLGKNDPQGFGSATTYARRYSLASMVGICPADDDGEGAMNRQGGNQKPEPQKRANGMSRVDMLVAHIEELLPLADVKPDWKERTLKAAKVSKWSGLTVEQLTKAHDYLKERIPAAAGRN